MIRKSFAVVLFALLAAPVALAGGSTWESVDYPTPQFCTPHLRDVTFPTGLTGFAVGTCMSLLKTDDAGATWERNENFGDLGQMNAIDFFGPTIGAAVGQNALFQPTALVTLNNGQTWEWHAFYLQDPLGISNEGSLTDVEVTAAGIFITGAVWSGEGAVVRSLDLGNSWETVEWSPAFLTAVESDPLGLSLLAVGGLGLVHRSVDLGNTWVPTPTGTFETLYDVAYVSLTEVWAVGASGTVLRSLDAGITWTEIDAGTPADLWDVEVFPTGEVYIVGDYGTARYTNDGGATWNDESPSEPTHLRALAYVSDDLSYAVGETKLYRGGELPL